MCALSASSSAIARLGESNIYASKVSGNFDQDQPFFYEREPFIALDSKLYDPEDKVLRFKIDFERPSIHEISNAKKQILSVYSLTDSDRSIEVVLNPLRIVSYEVWMGIFEDIFLLEKGDSDKGPYGSSPLPIRVNIKKVDDNENTLHQYLNDSPEDVELFFRPFYLCEISDISSINLSLTEQATSKAIENLLGPGGTHYVEREILQELNDSLAKSIKITFTNVDQGSFLIEKVIDLIFDFVDNLESISLQKVQEIKDAKIIYGVGEAKKELTPKQYYKLTTDMKSSENFYSEIEKQWEFMQQLAQKESTYSEFYMDIYNFLHKEDNYNGHGKVGIKFVNVSQKLNFDKKYTEINSSELGGVHASLQELRAALKDSGSNKQKYCREMFKEWHGEEYKESTKAKKLDVCKVCDADIVQFINAQVTYISSQGEVEVPGPSEVWTLEGIAKEIEKQSITKGKVVPRRKKSTSEPTSQPIRIKLKGIKLKPIQPKGKPKKISLKGLKLKKTNKIKLGPVAVANKISPK
jgi:hypothetical protein